MYKFASPSCPHPPILSNNPYFLDWKHAWTAYLSFKTSPNQIRDVSVVALGTACGLLISVKSDAQWYFNEAVGRASADFLRDEVIFFLIDTCDSVWF